MAVGNRSGLLLAVTLLGAAGAARAQAPKITLEEAIARANRVQPGAASSPPRHHPPGSGINLVTIHHHQPGTVFKTERA